MFGSRFFTIALVAFTPAVSAPDSVNVPRIGDTYEITMISDSAQRGSDGSSSRSHDVDTIIERVIGLRADGVELQYDVPEVDPEKKGARDWKFPVRILMLTGGALQLLNRSELDGRVDKWLKAAKWTREICGRWIFTWNAFHIECDPQAAADTVKAFDLRSIILREGALYRDENALAPGTITKTASSENRATFAVQLEADPNAVHRARAESDVVVAEISRKPVTFEMALLSRSKEAVKGIIAITFETDAIGNIHRRTKISELHTQKPDGTTDTHTVKQILERRFVPATRNN